MIASDWRIVILNETGVTIDASTITLEYKGAYRDSDGKWNYVAETTNIANQASTIADGAYHDCTAVDNEGKTNPYEIVWLEIDVNLSANTGTPDGDVIFLVAESVDGTVWPDDGHQQPLGSINFDNAKSDQTILLEYR